MNSTRTHDDTAILVEALQRIAADLTMITDRAIEVDPPVVERATSRAVGRAQIHISFKLGIQRGPEIGHGSWLVPLPEAMSLAGWLMMLPDDVVLARRASTTLDSSTKDALLEIGNFVAGACEAALRSLGITDVKVRSEGCQGVRADVRPALVYSAGTDLVVAHATARFAKGAPFHVHLMLPPIGA